MTDTPEVYSYRYCSSCGEAFDASDKTADGRTLDNTKICQRCDLSRRMRTGKIASPIGFDLPCRGCGYSLRGLPRTDACPECGESIDAMLRGNLLADADPDYVQALVRGLRVSEWGMLLLYVPIVCGGLLLLILMFTRMRPPLPSWDLLGYAALASMTLGVLLVAAGTLLSTVRERDRPVDPAAERVRRRARLSLVAVPAIWVVLAGVMNAGLPSLIAGGAGLGGLLVYLFLLAGFPAAAGWHMRAFLRHGSYLAESVPDRGLSRSLRSAASAAFAFSFFGLLLCGLGPVIALCLHFWQVSELRRAVTRAQTEQITR